MPTVFGLAADEFPLLEAAGKIHARHEIMGHVSDKSGMVAGLLQRFGDSTFLGRHWLPAGQVDVVPGDGSIVVEGEGPAPTMQRAPGGDCGQAFGVGTGEADALSGKAVDRRCVNPLVPIAAKKRCAQRIGNDYDDVWLGSVIFVHSQSCQYV